MQFGRGVECVDLVVERAGGQIEVHRPLPHAAPARSAAAVSHHDGETLVREPLRRGEGVVRAHDALRVRPTVRVEQYGQGRAVVVLRQQHGRGETSLAEMVDDRARLHERCFGERGEGAAVGQGGDPAGCVEHGRAHHHRPAGGHGVHTVGLGASGGAVLGVPVVHVLHGGVVERVAEEGDRVAAARDRPHLHIGRGDGLAVDQQTAPAVAVGGHDEASVGEARGAAGHQFHPGVVAVGEQRPRTTGDRVGLQYRQRALIARLRGHQHAVGSGPAHIGQIGQRLAVPLDLHRPAINGQHVQAHIGVGGARRRVAHHGGRLARLCRVGDVPLLDGRIVDAAGGDGRAVGAPPETTEAVHLLGGHEVGAAPGDLRRRLAGQLPARAVEFGDAQGGTADVRDAAGQRIGPRVEHRALYGQFAGAGGEQPGSEEPAGQGEGGHGDCGIGGVRSDATGALAHAFAAGALFGRQGVVVGCVAGQQRHRVGHQLLGAGGEVGHPQTVHRVVARPAAQEHDALFVG